MIYDSVSEMRAPEGTAHVSGRCFRGPFFVRGKRQPDISLTRNRVWDQCFVRRIGNQQFPQNDSTCFPQKTI